MDDALTPGLREEVITDQLAVRLDELDPDRVERRPLEGADGSAHLRRPARELITEWLRTAPARTT